MPEFSEAFEYRFWSKVQRSPDGCWLWMGSINHKRGGYGFIGDPNRKRSNLRANRVALALCTGRWPIGCVLHSCDNPPCVRPAHLREGTHFENSADAKARGRLRPVCGTKKNNAVLSESDVLAIRARYRPDRVKRGRGTVNPGGVRAIAADYGVAPGTIVGIVTGRKWKHI